MAKGFGQSLENIFLLSLSAGFLNKFSIFILQVFGVTLRGTGVQMAAKEVQIDLRSLSARKVNYTAVNKSYDYPMKECKPIQINGGEQALVLPRPVMSVFCTLAEKQMLLNYLFVNTLSIESDTELDPGSESTFH